MKRWIGRWLFGVGVVHCLFGVVFLGDLLAPIAAEGYVDTVNGQPEREFAVWFLATGVLLLAIGLIVDWNEARRAGWPRGVALLLTVLTIALAVIMPRSGVWLLLPPVVALWRGGRG